MAEIHQPLKGLHYEKSVCPHCGMEIYVRYQKSPQLRILGLVDKDGAMTSTQADSDITAIYDFWNTQHIIMHRRMTSDMAKVIKSELRNYTDTEIMQSIKNYAEIQKGEQYWFNYAWTLKDFLKRGIQKFMDLEIARANYLSREIQSKTQPIHKWCRGCGYKALTNEAYCPECKGHLDRDYTAGRYSHLIKQ